MPYCCASLGVENEKFTKSKQLPWSDHPMDIAHLESCKETDWSRCLFIRNGAKWQQQCKWLIVVRESDGVRFKCECCSKYGFLLAEVAGQYRSPGTAGQEALRG